MKDKNNNHKLLLRVPNRMYNVLKAFKELTGMPITSQIQDAIVTWLFLKKMINLNDLKENIGKNDEE